MTRVLLAIAIVALTVPVTAQRIASFEALAVTNTAVGITASKLTGMAGCTARLETAEVRFRSDGTAPTSAVGTLLEIGDVLTFTNILDASATTFIRTGAVSAVLDVSCWGR